MLWERVLQVAAKQEKAGGCCPRNWFACVERDWVGSPYWLAPKNNEPDAPQPLAVDGAGVHKEGGKREELHTLQRRW